LSNRSESRDIYTPQFVENGHLNILWCLWRARHSFWSVITGFHRILDL